MREALILATLVRHPRLIHRFEGELEQVEMTGPGHDALLQAILRSDSTSDVAHLELVRSVGDGTLDHLMSSPHVRLSPGMGEDVERAEMCVAEELAKLRADRGSRNEVVDTLASEAPFDESAIRRLGRAAKAPSEVRQRHVAGEQAAQPQEEFYGSISFRGGRRGRD
jgi:DNA primase